MNPQLYDIISIVAILSYFIPMLVVLIRKLWRDPFFMLFAAYWFLGGLVNVTDLIPGFSENTKSMIGVLYNLLDLPIIFVIFYYTASSLIIKRYISFSLGLFIIFEIIICIIYGITYDALKYTLGPGIALVLIVLIWEIIRYLQKIEHSNRQSAKLFIYAALLFEYGTFSVIYIFDYFIVSSDSKDSFLIYYISTLIAILIALCGYLAIRIKENTADERLHMPKKLDW